jgi:hypothetical protein
MDFPSTHLEVHASEGVNPGEALLDTSNDEERLSTHAYR